VDYTGLIIIKIQPTREVWLPVTGVKLINMCDVLFSCAYCTIMCPDGQVKLHAKAL